MTIFLDIFLTMSHEKKIILTFQEKYFHKMLKMTLVMNTRKEYYKNKMEEELDAVDLFEKSKNK